MIDMKRALLVFGLLASGGAIHAQAPSPRPQAPVDMVEVEPIKCWWRTSSSAVRTGEPFNLTLTCSVVETDANKVVADFSKLDPTVVQLPPFEVLGGTHAGDLVVPGKRFFQYDYRLRLIAEDAFGNDVGIPPLEISYRIESQLQGGESAQGRDQSYSLPRASVRLISLVPDDTTDIREAPAMLFTAIENRDSRANLMQTLSGILFTLAGVVVLIMLVSMLRRKKPVTSAAQTHLPHRAILSAVSRELNDVQSASRGGWTQELAGRALASARIAGAYAIGRAIGQRPADGSTPVDGVLVVRSFGRGEVFVSGSATTESAQSVPGLSDALRSLTLSRYGRNEKFDSMCDEALQTAIRVTKEQQSAHSLAREWMSAFKANVVDLRRKIWA
jgi:hypothetical protein